MLVSKSDPGLVRNQGWPLQVNDVIFTSPHHLMSADYKLISYLNEIIFICILCIYLFQFILHSFLNIRTDSRKSYFFDCAVQRKACFFACIQKTAITTLNIKSILNLLLMLHHRDLLSAQFSVYL